MHIANIDQMTPDERRRLEDLDAMILDASPDELKHIQQLDYMTQKDCVSFYDVYVDSAALVSSGRVCGRRGSNY